ncbi:MAG: DUF3575 domain-containing protein [Chitinophagaceae bacterium]
MKPTWIFIIFIFCTTKVAAQLNRASLYEDKLSLRLNPLGLVDVFDGNISGGIAYSLNQRWSITVDLSYIFYSTYLRENKGTSGYIFKPAIRYYVSESRKFYLESTVWYKCSSYKVLDWVDKDCVNGVPSYQEFKSFRFRKQVLGFNIQGGFQKALMKNKLLRMEIYAGIGVRLKWQEVKNDPQACYQPNDVFESSFYNPTKVSPGLPHGLRLVYVIR